MMQLFVSSCWSSLWHDVWFLQFHPKKTKGDSDASVLTVLWDPQGACGIFLRVITVYAFKYIRQQNVTDIFSLK